MRLGMTPALIPFALGVVLLGSASAGPWSLPDAAQGMRLNPLFLLSRPDIRDDLKIGPEQAAAIDREVVEVYRQAAALIGRTDPGVVAARRAVDERAARWIEEHLSTDQRVRLSQLELWWEGLAALTYRPAVADALSLSPEQQAALAKAVAARNAARARGGDPAVEQQKLTRAAMAVLSEGQRNRWVGLLGPPFLLRPATAQLDPQAMTAGHQGPGR
ncbi:hypothetical protein TA3x_002509 [Tundrisphaera sp. TA3]|uniref:hypothetical protein n=1 Tax=Tundrisphaera sp. TA3 TaxID=3435775 RepID=UPI003EBB05E3